MLDQEFRNLFRPGLKAEDLNARYFRGLGQLIRLQHWTYLLRIWECIGKLLVEAPADTGVKHARAFLDGCFAFQFHTPQVTRILTQLRKSYEGYWWGKAFLVIGSSSRLITTQEFCDRFGISKEGARSSLRNMRGLGLIESSPSTRVGEGHCHVITGLGATVFMRLTAHE